MDKKLTKASDPEPPLTPVYGVTSNLRVSLTSFYKSNTLLKPTATTLCPILEPSLAEKNCRQQAAQQQGTLN